MNTTKLSFKTVAVNGFKIFYREAGDPQKPTVLLLHGFPDFQPHVSQFDSAIGRTISTSLRLTFPASDFPMLPATTSSNTPLRMWPK